MASDSDNLVGSPSGSAPPLGGRRLIESQNEALNLIIARAPLARVFETLIAYVSGVTPVNAKNPCASVVVE